VEEEAERQERMREEKVREERVTEMQLLAALDAGGGGGQYNLPIEEPPVDIKREEVLGVSGDEAWRRRGMASHHPQLAHPPPPSGALVPPPPPLSSTGGSGGMTFAQKLMEKMGWKEGEGLGKQKQGIAAPLQVKKTADRAGIIVPGELLGVDNIKDYRNSRDDHIRRRVDNSNKSRVVVVRNVVGPGEVEPSLDEEVGTHCLARGYGEVEDVVVYEVVEPDDFPVEEAVRVFVKFSSVEEARRAVDGWDGRVYENKKKRVVRVGYFDETRFESGDLGPTEDEVERYYYGQREVGEGEGGGGRRRKKQMRNGKGRGMSM